jgi:hypothetical protein
MITTAAELLTHPDFLAFCACWERDRRIPIGMPDWLREQGADEQAKVADWCLNEPNRTDTNDYEIRRRKSGPSPTYDKHDCWGWFFRSDGLFECDDLLLEGPLEASNIRWERRKTFPEAIVYLLDNYKPIGSHDLHRPAEVR